MCGIAGIAERDPDRPAALPRLLRMSAAIAHRGPDGDGAVTLGPIGLAHRRLSIVDRTAAAAQPMSNPARTLFVVYNGEIYNHADERRHLESKGYRFRSQSDTEVLLFLYEEYGEACLERLQGMFAFAIWDARKRLFFLARDPFGKKPLYYRLSARRFAFASELKALVAGEEEAPAVDPEAVHHFLSFDYVPSPRSAFRGVMKLPPGHQLVYRAGELSVRRYFTLPAATVPAGGPAAAANELRGHLSAAVAKRLMGEVPVGVFLSGGVDSSTIVALLAEMRIPTRTFSIAFREPSHDERAYARQVATHFGTTHREIVVTPDLASELPRILRQYDEPFGDPSALPTYFLARESRRDITVALTGDGGDEAFAGYERYVKSALTARYLSLPQTLRRALGATAAAVPDSWRFEHPLRRIARFAALDARSAEELYGRWLLHFDTEQKNDLYTPEFRARVGEDSDALLQSLLATSGGGEGVGRLQAADVASYLPDDLLVKTDIATMAHGMEARCPFLDVNVMAFAAALPSAMKLRGLRTKWILKRAMRGTLPAEILNRPKRGFGIPIEEWLRGELRPLVHELLLGRRSLERGYFREAPLRRLVDEHERRHRQWSYHLWNLLALELWHREVVDAARPSAPISHA